jgi:hypothetical protein
MRFQLTPETEMPVPTARVPCEEKLQSTGKPVRHTLTRLLEFTQCNAQGREA